jgi:beta-lactamase superfamily II metal-dependent hydrolase
MVYSDADMNGNLSETLVLENALAHIYWHPSNGELNVVLSDTAAGTLPPATPEVTDGGYECAVTQMMDAGHVNGMSYVIQLKDGSYIIYDGGYSNLTVTLEKFLLENYKGEDKPVIRAWVLTHSHNDHYPVFQTFAARMRRSEKFILENVIFAPMNEDNYYMDSPDNYDPYFSTKFYDDVKHLKNTNLIFAHTGMKFTFCNLDLEILYSPESHYKTTPDLGNFNNTSIASRLYDENYSALFTGDVGIQGSTIMENLYGDYLKSDMCQISHHGVEDVPLSFYEYVSASILFYPCDLWLYDQTDRHWEERQAMEDWDCTKEILIAGLNRYTRAWGTVFEADAPLSMPDYTPPAAP